MRSLRDIDQKEVTRLYVTDILSVEQIAAKLNLSRYLVRKCLQMHGVKTRSISEAVMATQRTRFGKKGFQIKENRDSKEELLLVAGIMLYWGEGYKRGIEVALSNSDPKIAKLFLKFLRDICGINEDRLRVCIHAYKDHNLQKLAEFWSKETNIPLTQFHKPYVHVRKKGTYRMPSMYGTVSIRYCDKQLLTQILSWIAEYDLQLSS